MEQLFLKDVCSFVNGKAHEQYVDEDGKFILVTSKFIASDGESFRRTNDRLTPLEIGDLCMVMSDVPKGRALAKCFLVDKNDTYTLNQRIGAFRADDRFLKKYFYYQMNRNKYFLSFDDGDSQTNLRKDDILNCPLYCPSKAEQQVIVDILDKVSLVIKSRQEQLQDLDNLIKARFVELFGDLKSNDKDWKIVGFTDCADIDTNMVHDFEEYQDYPHIGIDSIEKETGRLIGYRTIAEDGVISGKYLFTPEHIIYSKIRPNLNKVAMPDFDGLCSADAYPILVKSGICNREYLGYTLRSKFFLDYILAFSSRTNLPKVNKNQVEGFKLPLPPIELQEQFADFVKQVDKSKVVVQKSLDETQKLFDSLMQNYFG